MRTTSIVLAAVLAAVPLTRASHHWHAAPAAAPDVIRSVTAVNDYSRDDYWLCRPGRQDACAVDLTATIVTAEGKLTREAWKANPGAPIDCFYVYPTVSTDTAPNSSMVPGDAERNVVRLQLARFGSKCRLYAPIYRQVTLAGLRAALSGGPIRADQDLAYDDVLDAWHYYLQHDNKGRGFVLIGHSQGARILAQLIKNEIDGRTIQSQMVTAFLLGANLPVPRGKSVGGAYDHIPLCRASSQTGCVVSYTSFRASAPPPANTLFGTLATGHSALGKAFVGDTSQHVDPAMVTACTNPAALSGGGAALHSYFVANVPGLAPDHHVSPGPWVQRPQVITTPFVSVPGMVTAECVLDDHGSYLAVTVHSDSSDRRAHDIGGDLFVQQILREWGLHLIDMDLAMGNFLDLLEHQSKAYLAHATGEHA